MGDRLVWTSGQIEVIEDDELPDDNYKDEKEE
jgi:hypothetical protein